jgi:hypothetical protein
MKSRMPRVRLDILKPGYPGRERAPGAERQSLPDTKKRTVPLECFGVLLAAITGADARGRVGSKT